jgi:hypothetical protein
LTDNALKRGRVELPEKDSSHKPIIFFINLRGDDDDDDIIIIIMALQPFV